MFSSAFFIEIVLISSASVACFGVGRFFSKNVIQAIALGLLSYVLLFACVRGMDFSPQFSTFLVVGYLLLNGILTVLYALKKHSVRIQLCVAVITAIASMSGAFYLPTIINAADSNHYAADAAWVFHSKWVESNRAVLGTEHVKDYSTWRSTRTSVCSLVWLKNLFSISIDVWSILRTSALLITLTVALTLNIILKRLNTQDRRIYFFLLLPWVLWGVSGNYFASFLFDAQINQVWGVLALVTVWSMAEDLVADPSDRMASIGIAIASASVLCLYPEISLILPVYLLGPALSKKKMSFRFWMASLVFALTGYGLNFLFHSGDLLSYFRTQAGYTPQWWPLSQFAVDFPYFISELFFSLYSRMYAWLGFVILSVAVLSFLKKRDWKNIGVISIVVMGLGLYYVLFRHNANPNYALFKLSGWLSFAKILFLAPIFMSHKNRVVSSIAVLVFANLAFHGFTSFISGTPHGPLPVWVDNREGQPLIVHPQIEPIDLQAWVQVLAPNQNRPLQNQ